MHCYRPETETIFMLAILGRWESLYLQRGILIYRVTGLRGACHPYASKETFPGPPSHPAPASCISYSLSLHYFSPSLLPISDILSRLLIYLAYCLSFPLECELCENLHFVHFIHDDCVSCAGKSNFSEYHFHYTKLCVLSLKGVWHGRKIKKFESCQTWNNQPYFTGLL